jgi:hypothetical protein
MNMKIIVVKILASDERSSLLLLQRRWKKVIYRQQQEVWEAARSDLRTLDQVLIPSQVRTLNSTTQTSNSGRRLMATLGFLCSINISRNHGFLNTSVRLAFVITSQAPPKYHFAGKAGSLPLQWKSMDITFYYNEDLSPCK